MKFLPDSMILGTAGRLRHKARKAKIKANKVKVAKTDTEVFKGRSVAELMELAGINKTRP
jgi:hypothetical protein